jgi:hypothetical protein
VNFPSFTDLIQKYSREGHACPDVSPSENLCAVRLSRAMLDCGHRIDPALYSPNNLCRHSFARGAQDLGAYLRKCLGRPSLGFSKPNSVPPALVNKKGIIMFANIPGFAGQGHIDLWNGTTTITGTYWNADPVWFWQLEPTVIFTIEPD